MSSLARTSETYAPSENRAWLASTYGMDEAQSITLDGDQFDAATFPDGTVPSGTVLAQVTSSGLYGPYAAAGADGLGTAAGHLMTTQTGVTAGARVSGPLLYRGRVNRDRLSDNSGLDAAAEGQLSLIRYQNS